jgi:vancomycin resistance protein YoaR
MASSFWFIIGFFFTGLLLLTSVLAYYRFTYKDVVYPGVYIDSIDVGEKSQEEVYEFFEKRNEIIRKNTFVLSYEDRAATISAQELGIGYNSELLAEQAFNLGRSQNVISNFYLMMASNINGLTLVSSYTYSNEILKDELATLQKEIYRPSVDAQFTVENNRVATFVESQVGRSIDYEKITEKIESEIPRMLNARSAHTITFTLPIKALEPKITTEKANNMGIVEVLGEGKSYFQGSIPNRIHNINLGSSRINGILVSPGETFSFNKTIGDISKFTGFKEAYVIQGGKTILGDGGGVCQVSTTLFRALLNAGLPVLERNPHAYRVAYYEQNFPPGLDAAIFTPNVDLKFKNDTKKHLLIQSFVDPTENTLTFRLYGTKDGRSVEMTKPIITSQSAPPEPLHQDDPTLPKGTVKQVEYAAWGATVKFDWTVKRNGEILHQKTFTTRYRPWQAVYLNGTKEG